MDIQLPAGNWDVCVNAEKAGTQTLETVSGKVSVEPISALILVKGEGGDPEPTQSEPTQTPTVPPTTQPQQEQGSGINGGLIAGILGAAAVIAGVVAGCVFYRKKKK